MKIGLRAGKYVVAVSGGVDSVVLLDLLSKQKDLELVVAHFDHGIRSDAKKDRLFVQALAKKYNLPFEYAEGNLGPKASEATARQARYEFLESVKQKYKARAIMTAHHQDDVLETVCLNILRGTGRKGLSSLGDTASLKRPLLNYSKMQITDYAKKHHLRWREDPTNQDEKYLRNWLRHNIIAKLSKKQRQQLLETQQTASHVNKELDELLSSLASSEKLDKKLVIQTDHKMSLEIIAHWLRQNELRNFDTKTLERIVVGTKTLRPGKTIPIYGRVCVVVGKTELKLSNAVQ